MRMVRREAVRYLVFGVITTVVGIGVYQGCHVWFNSVVSNTISTIVAVLVAFLTNKLWVFQMREFQPIIVVKEFFSFVGGRLFTYGLETGALFLLVDLCGYDSFICKLVTTGVVVVLNYNISKKFVFKVK